MKFITEPSVYLVIKPTVDVVEVTRFLDEQNIDGARLLDINIPTGELPVVIGGRNCYQSFSTGREHSDYIANILKQGHGSVLEHSNYGILITGVSRSLTHELIRHRQFGVSQLSQRFVEHDDCNFVIPPALSAISGCPYQFEQDCKEALEKYKSWLTWYLQQGLKGKEAKEAARAMLPNCTETRILITGDLRCWRVFFELRCDEGADKEIRKLANMCYEKLRVECPNVFADYEKEKLSDGSFSLDTPNRKV